MFTCQSLALRLPRLPFWLLVGCFGIGLGSTVTLIYHRTLVCSGIWLTPLSECYEGISVHKCVSPTEPAFLTFYLVFPPNQRYVERIVVQLDSLIYKEMKSDSGEEITSDEPLDVTALENWLRAAGLTDESAIRNQAEDLWQICTQVKANTQLEELLISLKAFKAGPLPKSRKLSRRITSAAVVWLLLLLVTLYLLRKRKNKRREE